MSTKTKALSESVSRLDLESVHSVEPKTPLKDVIAGMQKAKVGYALVCKGRKLVGIFTERDLVLRTLGLVALAEPVEKAMTSGPKTIDRKTTVGEAVELMHAHGFRTLPFLDEKGVPAGVVTVKLIIKYLAEHFPQEVLNLPPEPGKTAAAPEGA